MADCIDKNISHQYADIDLTFVCNLKNRMVGDQICKLQIFHKDAKLIYKLIGIDYSDTKLKLESLDLLLSLMNLDPDIRNQLDFHYADTVAKILQSIELNEDCPIELCYKTAKLVNLCLNNCDIHYKTDSIDVHGSVPECFGKLLSSYLSESRPMCSDERSVLWASTIFELSILVLKCGHEDRLPPDVVESLETLLLSIVETYIPQLDCKYVIQLSIPHKAHQEPFQPTSNKGLYPNEPLPFTSAPNGVEIYNPLDEALFWLTVVLYVETFKVNPTRSNLWLNTSFTIFIASLLKSNNINLRSCAVYFLSTPYFFNPKNKLPMQPLQLWLPTLINLVNYSDVPWWLSPIDTITKLISYFNSQNPLNNEVIEFLYRTNILHGLITVFVKCLSLDYQTAASLATITSYLKLFSQVTSNDEKCRLLLLEDGRLMQHLEHALQTHLDLLSMFLLNTEKMQLSLSPEDSMPPFYTSKLTLQWVTLLKSFSRSVNSLRTRLRRTLLGDQLLQLAETIYTLLKRASFASDELLTAEMEILAMVFAVISNFAMEFSNLQVYMVKHGVLQMAHDILVDPIFNDQAICNEEYELYKQRFPPANIGAVKVNVLWMLKHLIYNSSTEDKLDLLKVIPMDTILEYINDKNSAVQEQCFQLLRNLTCNSRKVINMLLYHFVDKQSQVNCEDTELSKYVMRSTYLFEFLTHKLRTLDPKNSHQMGTIVSIIHIIVNFTVINESKRHMVIEQEELLEIVKTILSESRENCSRYCNNEEAKLGCIWMLTNLIWNSSFSSYTHSAPIEYTPTAPTSDSSIRHPSDLRSARLEATTGASFSDDSEDNADADDEGVDVDDAEFVRFPVSSPNARNPALTRYRRLEKIGFYELIHERTFDEFLNVRERARTLLFHMDMLRKGGSNT
ncbi:HDL076Cp [Eremothecium sinecaudum]|uniref:HDL076Cp n=1 Tax=Eremothecium sinecaudum TaxID=45286 RepID=A0A109UZ79_9SACH|nr:HDL076Cp [Eremothecium sinecaudum]AMD20668.1 HDL076Cp [Eremothecium sinecaudum]